MITAREQARAYQICRQARGAEKRARAVRSSLLERLKDLEQVEDSDYLLQLVDRESPLPWATILRERYPEVYDEIVATTQRKSTMYVTVRRAT